MKKGETERLTMVSYGETNRDIVIDYHPNNSK